MKSVALHLAEGFEEIEAITVIDILRRAEINVITVSITKNLQVKGAHNIIVTADTIIENVNYDDIQMIVLPGGMPGAKNLNEHNLLKEKILSFHKKDKQIAAICAAPMILGELNLLENKQATCYPGFEKYLNGAIITNKGTEISNNIITAKGPAFAIEFALKIIEVLISKEKSKVIADGLLI